jgi:enamine deaminase RidA (YjgF/YER057c/UK114 family)
MTLYQGAPYEYSSVAEGLVFTAGACPLDDRGHIVSPGDYEAQATRTTENLLAALVERGTGADALLKTTVFVAATGRRDLVRVWDVIAPILGRVPSTLLGVSYLGYPDQLVEIEAIARVSFN